MAVKPSGCREADADALTHSASQTGTRNCLGESLADINAHAHKDGHRQLTQWPVGLGMEGGIMAVAMETGSPH